MARLKTQGFTLVELLIVIVLIGVMSSMAVLAMGNVDHGKRQQLEAERLSKLLALAAQEATIRGDSFAVEIFGNGYRFLSLQNDGWHAEADDDLFKARTLEAELHLTLKVDEQSRPLNATPAYQPQPQIVFSPDGAAVPFEVGIVHPASDRLFVVDDNSDEGLQISQTDVAP